MTTTDPSAEHHFPQVFFMTYDPETATTSIDVDNMPAFDTTTLNSEQVASILAYAGPALYRRAKVFEDSYCGRLKQSLEVVPDLEDEDVEEEDLTAANLSEFQMLLFMAQLEETDWCSQYLKYLDEVAPLEAGGMWESLVVHDTLRQQASPMFTEDNPIIREQLLEERKARLARVNQIILMMIGDPEIMDGSEDTDDDADEDPTDED